MQIQCPECHEVRTLTAEQFQASTGVTDCTNCSAEFDPLENLVEEQRTEPDEENTESFPQFAWEKTREPLNPSFWSYGVIAGITLFAMQFFYFKSEGLIQNPAIRPYLKQACTVLNCQLPLYQNINELSVLHSSFVAFEKHYILQTAIGNLAEFPQRYPKLKLTLLNFAGSAIAKRVFLPKDYLGLSTEPEIFDPSETVTIKLDLAVPEKKIGGFTIELI